MSRQSRRLLITLLVLIVATTVVAAVFLAPHRQQPPRPAGTSQTQSQTPPGANSDAAETPQQSQPDPSSEATEPASATETDQFNTATLGELRAVAPHVEGEQRDLPPQTLGSLDPRKHLIQVEFSRNGARIAKVSFSDIWKSAAARRTAEAYINQLQPEQPFDPAALDNAQRLELTNIAAADSITINDKSVSLRAAEAWSETGPGAFASRIVDADGQPIAEVTRQFALGATYDIALAQRVKNLSGQALKVQWSQFGPTDLAADTSGYIDRRRFDIGFLPDPQRQPDIVLAGEFEADRGALLKRHSKAMDEADSQTRAEHLTLWPNDTSRSRSYQTAWFGSMNRYFAVAVHPTADQVAGGIRSLHGTFSEIHFDVFGNGNADKAVIFTTLRSPVVSVNAGAEAALDHAIYAGPLQRGVLKTTPFSLLAMDEMILYSMGGCCTFLTFQWLANLLLLFLSVLHDYVVLDWGIAIIALVIVVRTLLHPLTKKSQINMQRFGKQMSAMKPELDKLQKKFGNDPKRMQVEQMRLMREHGLSPFQALGCLPMFLQMPIWLALWAMLYFAFEIRHQPAFYGVFQIINGWSFLGDLSSPDHFWMLPRGGFNVFGFAQIDALNLLPLLLGVVFYVQQKYMSPPPTPNMTAEQKQQQKIMKVMMVVMMPVFLYKAPSGLTLYIFTSTCIGIMESKYVRSHIDQLDLGKPGGNGTGVPRPPSPKKPKDTLARLWAEKLQAARAKRRQEPSKTFKKRK